MSKAEERDAANFAQAHARAQRSWDRYLQEDPELARIELGIAHCARILVTEPLNSPQYAQALLEDRRLRDQRYRLYQARTGVTL